MAEVRLPEDPFSPFVPTSSDPWDVRKANHLHRRAAFGLPFDRLAEKVKATPSQCVDALLNYDPAFDPFETLREEVDGLVMFSRGESIQNWWFHRMVMTPQPLQEKIALFWHNRFATSLSKVDKPQWMARQIDLFRLKGLGSFRQLLNDVTADPAMLVWLDGRTSRKASPNENYAREILELFTLGPGNYSEGDIRELARAFTGWRVVGDEGQFDKKAWDDGEKTVFGQKARFDTPSAIDLILRQERAPRFLATKLLQEFVHPEPPERAVAHYASRLLRHNWEIKAVLREILLSRWFYSEAVWRSKIKSPVELVVGGVVSLGGRANASFLREQTIKMGQSLLYPPNVKGWDGQEAWINANTVLVRFNYGMQLASQRRDEFARKSDLAGALARGEVKTADDVLRYFGTVLLDDHLPVADRDRMLDYLNRGTKDEPRAFSLNEGTLNTKVRGLIHLLMSTPEYQLL